MSVHEDQEQTPPPFTLSLQSLSVGITNLVIAMYDVLIKDGWSPPAARTQLAYYLRTSADKLETAAEELPFTGEGDENP